MAKCKHFESEAKGTNSKGMACMFECPKGADTMCNIPKRKPKLRRVKAWAIVRDEHEIEAITPQPKHFKNAYVPCTILIDEKYLKEKP